MPTALTTELDAVNVMLDCIGESPVSTLEVSGLADVARARALLNETSLAVQTSGWHFNSEERYQLVRDLDGYITVPPNVIKLEPSEGTSKLDVAQRGSRLYDRKNHTAVFTEDLLVDLVFFLSWEELPQAARRYITIRAARTFQARELGSDTLHKFSEAEEALALVDFKDAEGATGNYNMFNGSWSVASILDR